MKKTIVGVAVVVGTLTALAAHAGEKTAKSGKAVLVMADQVKFADVPNAPGVQMAPVEGDPSKGPSHFFLKFAPGFAAPAHHHTADHFGTMISGMMDLTVEGKETKLGPGAYWAFTGKAKHVTRCEPGAECVLFIDARSAWDVVPEKAPKAEGGK
jgi:quercetin dioxygenase-like cupin family protein